MVSESLLCVDFLKFIAFLWALKFLYPKFLYHGIEKKKNEEEKEVVLLYIMDHIIYKHNEKFDSDIFFFLLPFYGVA